jgi:hypothetical protein
MGDKNVQLMVPASSGGPAAAKGGEAASPAEK